ncbi:wax ester/triacylglycerol synthase family O-acyltransferase [Conexibacter sp. SYSU D00693]|uniref:wax ester/triacylglycerol synthase family O-acyltransferase n=1 Tax=Conexibacter sp. SYSU D00693 TaxID=2812560 RepID=UPI00196ABE55|nr:wax ester/triacylglycerol synthase family O-acyltransferase [Conexibacter sp. SYSU D00693]
MAEPLSPADRSSLAAEQGPVSMAVGGVMVLEAGPGLHHDRVLERVRSRLHLIPRYRQRLRQPAPGVTNPVWVDDDHFDLGWHVRRAALPPGSGETALAELVGIEMSRKLDRSRPLWELTVVDGLEGGRAALLAKMHHALVDGVAAVDIGTVLLDPSPEPLDLPAPEGDWQPRPYDRRRHLARLASTPAVQATKLLRDSAQRALATTDPRRAVDDLRGATELLVQLARTRPAAPMTSLNDGIGPNRRFAMVRAPLAGVKAAGKAGGGTVNDALLAAVAGMLRRTVDSGGREPVVLVPVSVRREGESGGNRISTVLVDLPTDVDDPLERVQAVRGATERLKGSAAVRAGALLVGASGWAPPLVSSTLARAMSGVRAFNLVVSNVPGPQQPFYLNGCRVLAAHPAVPLNPSSQGLTVGIISYDGQVCFGLLADRDLDPPLAELDAALRAALDELLAAA